MSWLLLPANGRVRLAELPGVGEPSVNESYPGVRISCMFDSLYLSRPWSACYEGDDDADKAAADKAAAEARCRAAAAAAGKTFTQDQVNHLIATDRRKLEDALKKTEKQYQDLLSSQSLTEQERKALQANLEMVARSTPQQGRAASAGEEADRGDLRRQVAGDGEEGDVTSRRCTVIPPSNGRSKTPPSSTRRGVLRRSSPCFAGRPRCWRSRTPRPAS